MVKKNSKLALVFIALVAVLLFSGCSKKPDEVLNSFMKELTKSDLASAKKYMTKASGDVGNATLVQSEVKNSQMIKNFYSKLKYEITVSDKSEKTASLKTKFTYPNLEKLFNSAYEELYSKSDVKNYKNIEQAIPEYINDKLKNEEYEKVTKEIELKLIKGDKTWLIEERKDIADILTSEPNKIITLIEANRSAIGFLKAFTEFDLRKASEYVDDTTNEDIEEIEKEGGEFFKKLLEKSEYKLQSCTFNSESSVYIKGNIKSPDLTKLFKDKSNDIFKRLAENQVSQIESVQNEFFYNLFLGYLNRDEFKKTDHSVKYIMQYDKEKNKWILDAGDDFINGVAGNIGKLEEEFNGF